MANSLLTNAHASNQQDKHETQTDYNWSQKVTSTKQLRTIYFPFTPGNLTRTREIPFLCLF